MKARRKNKSAKGKPAARRKPATAAKPAAPAAAPDPLDDFILSAARSLNLKIEPNWMPGVRGNLKLTLMLGAQVGEFALPDDAEPAPVFRA